MHFDFSTLQPKLGSPEVRRAGEVIFAMGEAGDVLYVLVDGEAQVRVGDVVLENVAPGGILGEMALLDDDERSRSATAVALTDCTIVAVDRNSLLDLVRERPALALEIAKVTVRRLRSTNFLTQHDALTRLPNRSLFQENCRTAILRAQRRGTSIAVLYLDLDHFAGVNESFGYAAGDGLLCDVAGRVRGALHELDVMARLGEDEFALLLEDLPSGAALAAAAQEILDDLARPFAIKGEEVFVTASIGVSCYPQDGGDPETLLRNAESAKRAAKEKGRNGFSFYSPELQAIATEALKLGSYLRRAIERNELLLNYQPRVAVGSRRITAVEALLRWRHPELGMIPPNKFIPIAEQAGIIEEIGEWVLRTACAQQKSWLQAGIAPERIAVNLSARQLRRTDLPQRIAAILRQSGLEPHDLELEITESAVMDDPARTVYLLKELRSIGVAVALDDFGTEYSSLGYLKQFPLDYLKIDQCFVRGIPGTAEDVAITKAIITLGKNLGLKVVAEGIETEEQFAFLVDQACEEAQGYLLSRPVAAEQASRLLQDNLSARAA
jgi:diguanylate cyclase (GGDEF)-like protein